MSNKTLRLIYTRMVRAQAVLAASPKRRFWSGDVACWVSPLAGLGEEDIVFGCRNDGALPVARGSTPAIETVIEGGVERLYAAIGAATAVRGTRSVIGFFERHEAEKSAWLEALPLATALPLILVVLPRWKGVESDLDLCRASRDAGVPGIAADAHDPIALYRVAQESLGRARAHGGAALIEGVAFALPGKASREIAQPNAVTALRDYLLYRRIATQSWMDKLAADLPPARN